MRPDQEIAERFMGPGTKRFVHRWGWVIQLSSSLGALVIGVAVFFGLVHGHWVVAIVTSLFCWAAAWLGFTQALTTRARRGLDYPNEMQ
jgi:hypothetical protein